MHRSSNTLSCELMTGNVWRFQLRSLVAFGLVLATQTRRIIMWCAFCTYPAPPRLVLFEPLKALNPSKIQYEANRAANGEALELPPPPSNTTPPSTAARTVISLPNEQFGFPETAVSMRPFGLV